MAIIKHKAMKSADYNAAIEYLEYEHTKTGELVKDEYGIPVFREDFMIEGINCEPLSFHNECHSINELYKKNQKRNEVKSHSYIISFDPRDPVDNGLTMQDVQTFGIEFASKYLPGYQTIVCTHSDGNNGSGNIHCHIVINSIRMMDVNREAYMDQFMDNLAGGKHRCTPEFERFIKSKVMEMCQLRGLYQVNLLEPAPERINDREYYLNRRGRELEGESYQTRKEFIRTAIRECAAQTNNPEEFRLIMQQKYEITVKESRGRYSFLLPDRERGITERQLGSIYTKSFIEKVIRREEIYYERNDQTPYRTNDYVSPSVKKLVDIASNEKAMQSRGYEHAVVLSNVKKMAETMNVLSEKKIRGMSELETAITRISETQSLVTKEIKSIEARVSEIKTVLQLKEEMEKIRPVIKELKAGKQSARFRKEHEGDLIIYKAAKEKLKSLSPELKSFSGKELSAEVKNLTERKNVLYEQRSQMKKDLKDLENAKHNLKQLAEKERTPKRERKEPEPRR